MSSEEICWIQRHVLSQDYLTLRLVRLKPSEEWLSRERGLFFIFIKSNGGKYVKGSVASRLTAGDVLVWNGETAGKLCVTDGGEMAFWCFPVEFEHLFPLFASNEICLLQSVSELFKVPKLYQSTTPLARECHRLLGEAPPQFNLDHRSQLLRVVGSILTTEFKNALPQRVGFIRIEDHITQVFDKLPTTELLALSVGELAQKFGCSRRHLNRLFHQHFGLSVAAFRMEMRLLKAVSLLRDPDVKIINVAEQCGFHHLGLFNTCFKRRFGESPGKWRKTIDDTGKEAGAPHEEDPTCPLRANGLCPWSAKPKVAARESYQIRKASPARALVKNPVAANGSEGAHPPLLAKPGKPQGNGQITADSHLA